MKTNFFTTALIMLLLLAGPVKATDAPDKTLLGKFELLCRQIGQTAGNYTLGGAITITDKANPTSQMDHIPFLFCKQGDEFYYRLGKTTTLNGDGVYLYIDEQSKKIKLSAQRKVTYNSGLKQFADLAATIQSEDYKMVSQVNGTEQTISLINDHHITCKAYAISFDKSSMEVKQLVIRLTNLSYPLNKDMDRVISVSITKHENTAHLKNYLTKDNVVRNTGGSWNTVSEFKDYRLIKM